MRYAVPAISLAPAIESHLETIPGSPCHYAPHLLNSGWWPPVRHSFSHAHLYLVWKREPVSLSGQTQCRLDRRTRLWDGHLFDREREGKGESTRRVEGWAGLETVVSHRPLCHDSHAKIPLKDTEQLTGTHLPNQVL